MKNLLIALGLTVAASSAAYADGSTALDAVYLPQQTAASNPAAPVVTDDALTPNLIAGTSPRLQGPPADATIDFTATASIGATGQAYANPSELPRFGDGVRAY